MNKEEKLELYKDFIKQMLDFGYHPWFVGKMLAYVFRAIDQLGEKK